MKQGSYESEKYEPVLRDTEGDYQMGAKFDTPEEAREWAQGWLDRQYKSPDPASRLTIAVYRHLIEEVS